MVIISISISINSSNIIINITPLPPPLHIPPAFPMPPPPSSPPFPLFLLRVNSSSLSHAEARRKCGPGASPETRSPFAVLQLRNGQQLRGLRAVRSQNLALALAPRTFALNTCNNS
eukprot:2963585-Pyramimonas_sp.AAC.1